MARIVPIDAVKHDSIVATLPRPRLIIGGDMRADGEAGMFTHISKSTGRAQGQVPLGGPRAMGVRRTLPQRSRSLIGGWCFVDHYGPEPSAMVVPPHPHTGLQTAWSCVSRMNRS